MSCVGTLHCATPLATPAQLTGMCATIFEGSRPSDLLSGSGGQDHAECEAPACFMITSGGVLGDGQTEAYLKDMGMTDLVSAWAMIRRRPV